MTEAAATAVEQSEIALVHKLGPLREHPWLKAAEPLSKMADQPPMLALAGVGLAVGVIAGHRPTAEAGLRMLLSVGLATAGKAVVKRLVRRTRPHVVLDEGRYEAGTGGSERKQEQSFPSGHTADAVSAARAVARVFPRAGLPLYGLAGVVAALQPAGAKHYPTDVAAGGLIGWAAEALVDRALRALSASAR